MILTCLSIVKTIDSIGRTLNVTLINNECAVLS
jgi:hypothetical protein